MPKSLIFLLIVFGWGASLSPAGLLGAYAFVAGFLMLVAILVWRQRAWFRPQLHG